MSYAAIELDLSRYAVPRPTDSVAKKEFDYKLYDPYLDGLQLFLNRRKPLAIIKPYQKILDAAITRRKEEFLTVGTAKQFEAQRPKEVSSITHEYGLLDAEELKRVENSFQRVHLAEISAEIISHLRNLTSVSAGQIYEAAQLAFANKPEASRKQMLASIKKLLYMYSKVFSILEGPPRNLAEDNPFPLSMKLDAISSTVHHQVGKQLAAHISTPKSAEPKSAKTKTMEDIQPGTDALLADLRTKTHVIEVADLIYPTILGALSKVKNPRKVLRENGLSFAVMVNNDSRTYQIGPLSSEVLSDDDIFHLLILQQSILYAGNLVNRAFPNPANNSHALESRKKMVAIAVPLVFAELYSKTDREALKDKSLEQIVAEGYGGREDRTSVRIIEAAAQNQLGVLPKTNIFSPRCLYHQPGGYYVIPGWFVDASLIAGLSKEKADEFTEEDHAAWLFSETESWGEE